MSESLEDKAQRIRDFNMKMASGEFTEPTDLQNLKDVFDAIGVEYYYEQNESKSCIHVNNGCFDCCGVVFNFKDYKFTDATPRT